MSAQVCVCVRERKRERKSERWREKGLQKKQRAETSIAACVWSREGDCAKSEHVCVRERNERWRE